MKIKMKDRTWSRVGTAIAGALCAAGGLLVLAETFFHLSVSDAAHRLLTARTPLAVLLALLIAVLLIALGVCCVCSLIPDKKHKTRGFVMQKGENGVIGVSVRSIEGLVQTCVRQYPEISQADVSVVEKRDGIIILLDIEETAGVNIPLSVGALQKQIRQYVSSCTGVDVHEVRVLVESSEGGPVPASLNVPETAAQAAIAAAAATAVVEAAPVLPPEMPVQEEVPVEAEAPELPEEEPAELPDEMEEAPVEVLAEEIEAVEEPAEEAPVQPVAMPVMPDMPEIEDDRPLHQRLFGAEEQPAFVPAPPELVIPPVEAEEIPAEEAEETVSLAEADDADAVAEVAQAIAFDGIDLYEIAEDDGEPAEEAVDEAVPEAEEAIETNDAAEEAPEQL